MKGGKEDPCVPRHALLKLQLNPDGSPTGQFCPRFELRPENVPLAEIAWFAVKLGGDHPLFSKLFDMQAEGLDPEAKLAAFYKVINAVSNDGIAARIKAARERALREKSD